MKFSSRPTKLTLVLITLALLIVPIAVLVPANGAQIAARPALNTPIPEPSPTVTEAPPATLAPVLPGTIFPTVLPLPTVSFAGDKFTKVALDKNVVDGVGRPWLSFVNINDKPATLTPGTPTPANQIETVYIAAPAGGSAIRVIDLPATVNRHVYWSPDGGYLAYFLPTGSGAGLYVLDIRIGVSLRLFELDNLNPRGIQGDPVWSPDSQQITIALPTDYSVNIYGIKADGTGFANLTNSKAFDFWPAWSPDGQFMAFVSDRQQCPNWIPNQPGSCYRPDTPIPDGGNLYVMEAVSGQVRLVSDQWVTAPPHWISASRLAFTSGKRGDLSSGSSLWWADLRGGPAHKVSSDGKGLLVNRDSWTSDGKRVVYQEAQATTQIVIHDDAGNELARSADLNFPRVAFTASWSPDGKRLVMGGHEGQCPYGMILTDDTFKVIVKSDPTPGVCDPSWSPDGRFIAFNGVTQSASGSDGRSDVFIAEATGYGARNLSARLGGQIRLIGWINGS